ncbi:DNA processing protein [Chitinophaga sp. CF118]|uniref:DNA-processing protein DprA n=1 Tax=Chitinophaga sp. CF118 TaxID=1884367 RepID=UPI0008EC9A58|nr:DNA-processing protein DprA [Chitinophaga sp. CF118]SFD12144.1 DNA processing protein [Chitinophaga sp. CF118]
MQEELRHQIALTQISQIGDIIAKKLLTIFGTASAIFKAAKRELECIEGVGTNRANAIKEFKDFSRVEKELLFIEKYNIQPLFYTHQNYPQRLQQCTDSPVMLYFKGQANLNATRIVNVVGTRTPGEYGKQMCARLVKELAPHNIMVVSGLAYGIDILAHKTAIENDMPTIGVLAHGLDRIYPEMHKEAAIQMLDNGGLLTEFLSETSPDKQNFPKRNRIVAGIADATIVIESGKKGGSLITADIANSYNRDVLAVPGRVGDPNAAGCHHLIKTNQAMLITDARDLLELMGWDSAVSARPHPQKELFITLSAEEQHILALFAGQQEKHIDEICRHSTLPGSQVASLVFQMEMQHVLKSLPGQKYQLV